MNNKIAFIIITEKGKLERESMLLADSLRAFGGTLRDAPIYSFEPWCDSSQISDATKKRFLELGVEHQAIPLNVKYPKTLLPISRSSVPIAKKDWMRTSLFSWTVTWFF
jgi:hypothetical protein